MARVDHICTVCKLPVLDGEARFGPTSNHYACEKPRLDVIEASYNVVQGVKRIDEAIAGLREAIKKYDERGGK